MYVASFGTGQLVVPGLWLGADAPLALADTAGESIQTNSESARIISIGMMAPFYRHTNSSGSVW